jgi:predicted MFS family arabinose efflux permease
MFTTQFFAAYPLRIIPLLGAAVATDLAIAPSSVGYFASLASLGTLAGIVLAPFLVRSIGVLRTLQGCLLASAIGAVAFLFPYLAAVCLASLLVGLADGPAGFAASRELHRTAPPRARRLLFAISSMGGSFGSLTSAILVAFVVALTDWRTAILVTVLLTALATVPLRLLAGAPHGGAHDVTSHPTEGYARAMALMAGDAGLRRLVIGATLLAMSQGAWLTFFVAYVVDTLELSLPRAAALLAVTQALALGSRLAFSRWADHMGSARPVFVLICMFAMVSWLGLASLERGDSFTLLHVVVATSGISIAAWNGLTGAELASRVPDSALVAVNGVTAISMTVGYAIAVAGLAWLAQHMSGYAVPFLIIAAALALNALNFALLPRSSDS